MLTFQTSSSRLCGRLPNSGPVEPWQGQCLAVMVLLWDSVERKFWVRPPADWSSVTRLSGSSYPSPSSESSLLLLDVAILPLPPLYLKKVEVISNSIWHPIRVWFLHTSNNSHLGIPLSVWSHASFTQVLLQKFRKKQFLGWWFLPKVMTASVCANDRSQDCWPPERF